MFNKNWSNQIKKLLSSRGSDPLKMKISPYRDWAIVVGVFFVGFVFSLGFNIYISIKINQDDFFATSSKSNDEVVLNKEGLTKVLKELSDKEKIFNNTSTGRAVLVDPSL